MIDSGGCRGAKIGNGLRAGEAPQYLPHPAVGESVAELRPALNRPEEQQIIAEQLNRGLPVPAPDIPCVRVEVPSQRETVHRLLDPPLLVDDR